jgi:hypothetical protein
MTNAAIKLFIAGLLAAVPVIAQSAGKIRVCVAGGDKTPGLVVLRAETIASGMLATAGVTVKWSSRGDAACPETSQSGIVNIDLITGAPAADHPGAFAYARPYQGSEIVVMLDRIEYSCIRSSQVSNVLAHTMTHEIAHLLQGVPRHSETGVMKAQWRHEDFDLMVYHPLPFTPQDIELIQLGLARRARGFAVAAPPATEAASCVSARKSAPGDSGTARIGPGCERQRDR